MIKGVGMVSPRMVGMLCSVAVHTGVIVGSGYFLAQPIEYGVESGAGGMEIQLVAAPAQEEILAEAPKMTPSLALVEQVLPVPVFDKEEVAQSKSREGVAPAKKTLSILSQKQVLRSASSTVHGDGSSRGALLEAKPNYLKNPAPSYPYEARKRGWSGIVYLVVTVDTQGHVIKVDIESSSGYEILDNSALKTVKSWRFQSARLGGLPIESIIRVPIRFELTK